MSVLAPLSVAHRPIEPVGDWRPSRYTATLSGTEEFTTDADRLLAQVRPLWSVAEAEAWDADVWQAWLLRHLLETYPPDWPVVHLRGQLRYKQVVISLARQNGKSLVAALLAFYFLTMHVRGPRVASFASIEGQAKIVYDRVRYAIDNNPALSSALTTTATRGIAPKRHTGVAGLYRTYPAKEDSVQGEPFSAALYDELHIGDQAVWDAIVVGQRARPNAMLVGITTAGDADSALLLNLYRQGAQAIDGHDERFGFFVWEGASDELTEENVIRANPAVACGRIPLAEVMDEATRMWGNPKSRAKVIRYTLNRFLDGTEDAWTSSALFDSLVGDALTGDESDIVYALDRTPDWSHVSIHAGVRRDGIMRAEYVARVADVDHEFLVEVCKRLAARGRCTFAMPSDTMREVGRELKDLGYRVFILGATEVQTASSQAAAAISRRTLVHDGHPIVKAQSARARKRVQGESWRVSRSLSPGPVDAVTALVALIFVLETQDEMTIDLI